MKTETPISNNKVPRSREHSMSQRERAFALVVVIVTVLLMLALLEGVIRFQKRNIAYQPDPDLIRSLRPNVRQPIYIYETEDTLNSRSKTVPDRPMFLGYNRTNNVGLRMLDDVGAKPLNEKRVLLLGDSFTEGLDVRLDARFSELAQRELDGFRSDGSPRWRILNAGIQNGTPSQYILQLRRYLNEFQPDLVIVCLAPNDLTDDSEFERTHGFVLDPDGYPVSPRSRGRLWLMQKVWLMRYLEVFLGRFMPRAHMALFPPAEPGIEVPPWPRVLCTTDNQIQVLFRRRTGRYLVHLKGMAESRKSKFGVLMIHYEWGFPDEPYYEARFPNLKTEFAQYGCPQNGPDPYMRFIEGFLREYAIPFRNPYGVLLEAKHAMPSRKLWNYYDYHFSPAGHQIMGHELAELVRTLK